MSHTQCAVCKAGGLVAVMPLYFGKKRKGWGYWAGATCPHTLMGGLHACMQDTRNEMLRIIEKYEDVCSEFYLIIGHSDLDHIGNNDMMDDVKIRERALLSGQSNLIDVLALIFFIILSAEGFVSYLRIKGKTEFHLIS